MWLDSICGGFCTWEHLDGVRAWCKGAKARDELYLDGDLKVVGPSEGEIVITCN